MRSQTIGGFQVGMANFFVGFNVICNKFLITTVPISVILELRYIFGALILLPIILTSKNGMQFYLTKQRYTHREKFIYLLMALSGGAVFNAIYMVGMRSTTAIATGVISSTIPIIIVFLSVVFLREKIEKNHVLSAVFVALGICILNLGHTNQTTGSKFSLDQTLIGNFIVFLAMIPEAMFTIFAKMLNLKINPLVSAFFINLINALCCIPFFLFTLTTSYNLRNLSLFELFLIFSIGLFSGALFYSFYNSGISKIKAQTAGLLTGVIPISTAFLSLIFLKESFGLLSFIGMFFVLTSIYIGVRTTNTKAIP